MAVEREPMSQAMKVLFGAQVGLLVTLLCAGLLFWKETSERLVLLERAHEDQSAADALVQSHGEQLEKLWRRTSQNRDGVNALREGVNTRHPEATPLPAHRLSGGD